MNYVLIYDFLLEISCVKGRAKSMETSFVKYRKTYCKRNIAVL